MPTRIISMELDGVNKTFTVPDSPTLLELDICFNELKKAWQKQQNNNKKTLHRTVQS